MTPETPKNRSGLTQIIAMGESIHQIWVKPASQSHLSSLVLTKDNEVFKLAGKTIIGNLLAGDAKSNTLFLFPY